MECRKMCMFPYGNIGGIGTSNVPGITKQSLLKSERPENERCYEYNWAATSKGRKIELSCNLIFGEKYVCIANYNYVYKNVFCDVAI